MRPMRALLRRIYREVQPRLFARTNYKLFLRHTFHALDLRVAATMVSMDVFTALIKPIPVRAPFGESMLVVAPHHDDEVIGCGGAMLLQRRSGKRVSVVFSQDGGNEHLADGRSREEQVGLREAEATEVASELGIEPPRFLRHQHLSGDNVAVHAQELREEIERTRADVIFAPFFLDTNHEHRETCFALAEALASSDRTLRIMGYEVWGLVVPNVILNIDQVASEKFRLLELYASQLSGRDYVNGISGLNMYHAMQFGAGECRFAERFFEIPSEDFVQVVRRVREKLRG